MLSELDSRMSEWENLRTIDLHCNEFLEFPGIISHIPGLVKVNISKNKISTVDLKISLKISELDLSFNNLFYFAANIHNIQKLDLCHNQLTIVPECLQECIKLVI
jgi:Leucine-rich repeat (LRR) protein